jgi:hypothetical protein
LHQLDEQQFALAVDPTAEFDDVVEIEDEEICAESDKGGDYDESFEAENSIVDAPYGL